MPAEIPSTQKNYFLAQVSNLEGDLNRLDKIFQCGKLPYITSQILQDRYSARSQAIKDQLGEVMADFLPGKNARAWEALVRLQLGSQDLMSEALEFFGGLSFRKSGLDQNICQMAEDWIKGFAQLAGVNWSPVVYIGLAGVEDRDEQQVIAKGPQDELVCLPFPRWDFWYLSVGLHDLGYHIAKYHPSTALTQFIDQELARIREIWSHGDLDLGENLPWLPEIIDSYRIRQQVNHLNALSTGSREEFDRRVDRQRIHFWHLFADAFGAYFGGPAYAYALLFLILDPSDPIREGRDPGKGGRAANPYTPSSARRMATVLEVLAAMNESTKIDQDHPGYFRYDIDRLLGIWEQALLVFDQLELFQKTQRASSGWSKGLIQALYHQFPGQARQSAELWDLAITGTAPAVLAADSGKTVEHDARLVVLAAWWCRARYPDRMRQLTENGWKLLAGEKPIHPLADSAQIRPVDGKLWFDSYMDDYRADIQRLASLFRSNEIGEQDRNAVAGRVFRLLSEHDYEIAGLRKLTSGKFISGQSIDRVLLQTRGELAHIVRGEALDFLGGIILREENLDEGICALADDLMRDYARMAGINWGARVIPGKHPLFKQALDLVHLRFPDWDLWNLPLMAHEFGHIIATSFPEFDTFFDQQLHGHAAAAQFQPEDDPAGNQRRARHFHEFFGDAFAVYCQGPAFACAAILLNFNPHEAQRLRGDHPTYAERVVVIEEILKRMNLAARIDPDDPGPYAWIVEILREWMQFEPSQDPQEISQHKLRELVARTHADQIYKFLRKYFRLGNEYRAGSWHRSREIGKQLLEGHAQLASESLRDLLNIAWYCRLVRPEAAGQIHAKVVEACQKSKTIGGPHGGRQSRRN